VNYLNYPEGFKNYHPEVKAWYTARAGDEWITNEIAGKKVMIFIPEWDEEYDNVYLTTIDNTGYKMGFAAGDHHKRLNEPALKYSENPIDINKKPVIVLDY